MIRLLRKGGVIVGAEESFPKAQGGEFWQTVPIVDLDETCVKDCVLDMVDDKHIHKFKEDGMEKVREWCSHWIRDENNGAWWANKNSDEANNGWLRETNLKDSFKEIKFCPICAAPKPTEPVKKILAEELYEAYNPNLPKFGQLKESYKQDWINVADRAKELLIEKG